MTITPQDIQNREFREQFRGYNEDDVDTFLDEVAEEFGRVYTEVQRLRIQLASIQEGSQRGVAAVLPPAAPQAPPATAATTPAPAPPPRVDARDRAEAKEEMKRALVATQRAAEAALEEAKRRAAEIVARAEQRAKEIDDLTARRAKDIDSDASTALTYAQQRVEELRRQETEIRGRLRRMLAEHIKALQHLESEGASPQAAAAASAPAKRTPPTAPPAGGTGAKARGAAEVAVGAATQDPHGRSPVVDRMTKDLGEAAGPSASAISTGTEQFWRR